MKEVPRNDIKKADVWDKIGSGLDRMISVFNPRRAYQRQAFRQANRIMGVAGGYRGAKKDRLRADWSILDGSADEENLSDLEALRARTRDLNRNDAHASGITNTIICNDIGTGIRPQSRVDNTQMSLNDKKIENFQIDSERVWRKWIPFASADNKLDFYDLQYLCDRQMLETGEFLIIPLMIQDPRRPYDLALLAVEPDRLMTPSHLRTNKSVRAGIELGDRGEPLAYWIRKSHPGDMTLARGPRHNGPDNFIRYPAFNDSGRPNVLHIFTTSRPGQSRGVPFFAPVLNYFKDLADYMEAELVAARIAACFALFITRTDNAAALAASTAKTNAAGQRITELEPGIVEHLNAGESIESFKPDRPGDTFEPFVDRILRAISSALGLPYELVAKDFSKTNFSSARAALLEARRYFRWRQQFIANKLCQPVWNMLMEEAFLKGDLRAKNFFENKNDFLRTRWITPGWEWVDPKKEAEAARLSINAGISTLADEAAARGADWEEQLGQRAREKVKIKELEKEHDIVLFEKDQDEIEADPPDDEDERKERTA